MCWRMNTRLLKNTTHEKELNYIREGSSKLRALLDMGLDKDIYKQVEYLYDLIHSSPAKSDISVYDYEQKVLELINTLKHEYFVWKYERHK